MSWNPFQGMGASLRVGGQGVLETGKASSSGILGQGGLACHEGHSLATGNDEDRHSAGGIDLVGQSFHRFLSRFPRFPGPVGRPAGLSCFSGITTSFPWLPKNIKDNIGQGEKTKNAR